jgi:hypothetical protein
MKLHEEAVPVAVTPVVKRPHHRFGARPLEEAAVSSDDIKAVQGPGYTDNYFGGQGSPDGPGHGHVRVDEQGSTLINRGSYTPGEPNGRINALEQDSRYAPGWYNNQQS